MLLVGRDGRRFALQILGYEFPDVVDDEYDSNWLRVHVDVEAESGSWRTSDSCLLTSEAMGLSEWLDALGQGHDTAAELDFIEPNLTFELVEHRDELVKLRVWFELDLRPSWASWNRVPQRDLCVELDVNCRELREAATSLREQLRVFPPRGI